jgi:hypothetical protein
MGQALAAEPVSASDHAPALNTAVCAPDGVAVGGYDLVSYFSAEAPQLGAQPRPQLRPQLGIVAFDAQHQGLNYRFVSQENRTAFLADPKRYIPSYRGWCSTNLSMGRLACPDYTNYKIEHGRLLFFERVGFTNGLDIWNSDPLLHKRQADQNFSLLSTRP